MSDNDECPGPDCRMCNGEVCFKCGAGCWNNDAARCEHDVVERHEAPVAQPFPTIFDHNLPDWMRPTIFNHEIPFPRETLDAVYRPRAAEPIDIDAEIEKLSGRHP